MSVDYSALRGWVDAASMEVAAASLGKKAASFAEHMGDVVTEWTGLETHYITPHSAKMYSALQPSTQATEQATAAMGNVQAAIESLTEMLGDLVPRRDALIQEAEEFNALEIPEDPGDAMTQQAKGDDLAARIAAVAAEYQQALDDCAMFLSGINAEGVYTPPWQSAATGLAWDQSVNGGSRFFDSIYQKTTVTTSHWSAWFKPSRWGPVANNLGKPGLGGWLARFAASLDRTVESAPKTRVTNSLVFRFGVKPAGATFWERAWNMLKDPRHGGVDIAKPTTVKTAPNMNTTVGVGKTSTAVSTLKIPGWAAAGGKVLGAVGVGLTFNNEYGKAQERYASQNPEMNEDERALASAGTATVRTGGQVGATVVAGVSASALAGATLGSAVPVAGTAAGFVVGLGVGLAQAIPIGEGRTFGDLIGDGAEATVNFIGDAAKAAWDGIAGLFG